ncbi:MAG: SPOR domain-containing protein [Neisseriaceae bacterium]|nr:SPOR domain-containing protein [Neisseriaceae bacterium]
MYFFKQQGKGLFTFFAGIVLALIAVLVMMFALRGNEKENFKDPELAGRVASPTEKNANGASQTETLIPNNIASVASAASSPADLQEILPIPASVAEQYGIVNNVIQPEFDISEASAVESKITHQGNQVSRSVVDNKKAESTKNTIQQTKSEANTKIKEKETVEKKIATAQTEKTQTVSKQVKQTSKTQQAAAEPVKTEKATSNKKGSAVIQAGAYSNKQAAQEQRANLALLGVHSKVVEVQNNGKTIYRVQTDALSKEEVKKIEKTLANNGINSYIRH